MVSRRLRMRVSQLAIQDSRLAVATQMLQAHCPQCGKAFIAGSPGQGLLAGDGSLLEPASPEQGEGMLYSVCVHSADSSVARKKSRAV